MNLKPYAKAVVAAAGAAVMAAEEFWAPDTTVGRVLVIVSAALTAVGVYAVPNRPSGPAPVPPGGPAGPPSGQR